MTMIFFVVTKIDMEAALLSKLEMILVAILNRIYLQIQDTAFLKYYRQTFNQYQEKQTITDLAKQIFYGFFQLNRSNIEKYICGNFNVSLGKNGRNIF